MSTNIVSLTAREHFICHLLLIRMVDGLDKSKMVYAAWQQSRSSKFHQVRITSRTYEYLRSELSRSYTGRKRKPFSDEARKNMSIAAKSRKKVSCSEQKLTKLRLLALARKGKSLTKSHKERISFSLKGRTLSEKHRSNLSKSKQGKRRNPFSKQWRENLSRAHLGKKASEATRKKMSLSQIGKNKGKPGPNPGIPRTDAVKKKISDTKQNLPHKICPHCGLIGKGGNMIRYHFDKCRSLNDVGFVPLSN